LENLEVALLREKSFLTWVGLSVLQSRMINKAIMRHGGVVAVCDDERSLEIRRGRTEEETE
jgi:hypothetical protein